MGYIDTGGTLCVDYYYFEAVHTILLDVSDYSVPSGARGYLLVTKFYYIFYRTFVSLYTLITSFNIFIHNWGDLLGLFKSVNFFLILLTKNNQFEFVAILKL